MTAETTTIDYPKGLTFEQVWAAFMEDREHLKETDRIVRETARIVQENTAQMKETDRLIKETDRQMKETDRRMKETDRLIKENAEQMKETDKRLNKVTKNLGGLNNSMGDLIATLIAARLWEKFSAFPYDLKRGYQSVYIYNEKHEDITDIDILLSNTEWVMAVEVKNKFKKDDITDHLIRMQRIQKYPPAEVKGKKLLGAIAGGIVPPDVRNTAYQCGFFVIELKGESAALVPPPEGFSPKIW